MKLKSIPMMLTLILFIVSATGLIIMFMKLGSPTGIGTIATILLLICSMSEFVRTRKLQKLVYPLIVIYFLVILPIIGEFINNRVLYITFVVLSFVITMIFLYRELTIRNKEKNL